MDDAQLQQWVERVSLQWFGRPFLHLASWNRRLKSTGGRYFTGTHHIEISPHQVEEFGMDEVEKIIKHELCHYHLHLLKKGYKHRDADFRQLLAQVGGSRFCRSLPSAAAKSVYRYLLVCTRCSFQYPRKRKVDPSKYVCGKCRGKLALHLLDLQQKS